MARIARLSERGYVAVEGRDAEKFLQGLITNDMDLLHTAPAMHAALLSPQGKILFEFMVVRTPAGFLLETGREQAANLVKRLTLYKLRAKVEITAREDLDTYAVWGEGAAEAAGPGAYADPRHTRLGLRMPCPAASAQPGAEPEAAYDAHRIALGIPEVGKDYALGDTFPHEAGFDLLSGVAFDKGCFVGQEVVSRMQHRGTARKRFVIVDGRAALPPRGTDIVAGSDPALIALGAMGSAVGQQGLALVRIDRAAEALSAGSAIRAGDVEVSLRVPDWAAYSLAAASAMSPG
jgi:hypothetical protein